MSNRDQAPNSAFACIVEIKGQTHRLLRHHTADVQDGTEHDTVDVGLLKASLNLVDQLKERGALTAEQYEEARAHLQSHARTVVVDPQPNDVKQSKTDPRRNMDSEDARKIVSQQLGGPSGNQNLTSPTTEGSIPEEPNIARKAEEQLMQDGGKKGSITGKGSTATEPAEKSTENPAGVKGDIKHEVDKGPAGADVEVKKGKVAPADKARVSETDEGKGEDPGAHTDNGEKLVGNPNADLQDDEPESSKGAKTDAASTTTKTGKEPVKKAKPELENDLTPEPKGAKAKKAKGEDDMDDEDKADCELEKDAQPAPKGEKAEKDMDRKKKDGKKSKSEKNPLAQKKK